MSILIRVEKCEKCGKSEEFKGSIDDCDRFCRECFKTLTDDELDCFHCANCDDDP